MNSFSVHAKSEPADSNPNFQPIDSARVNCYDPLPEPAERKPEPNQGNSTRQLVRFYGYVNAMQRQNRNELLEKLYMLQLATPLDSAAIKRASQDYEEMAAIARTSGQFLKYLQGEYPEHGGEK